jgi:sortase A
MSRTRRAARYASGVFLACAVAAFGYAAFRTIEARVYQRNEARRFAQTRAAKATDVSIPRALMDGESIGEIVLERLGIHVVIAQGDSDAVLARAVGHLPATALPGATGNAVLAAHRDTFFRPLKDVRAGDVISLKTYRGDFDYVVESTRVVQPTDVWVLEPTGGRTLTLITCFPFSYVGAAPNRFIVRARAIGG